MPRKIVVHPFFPFLSLRPPRFYSSSRPPNHRHNGRGTNQKSETASSKRTSRIVTSTLSARLRLTPPNPDQMFRSCTMFSIFSSFPSFSLPLSRHDATPHFEDIFSGDGDPVVATHGVYVQENCNCSFELAPRAARRAATAEQTIGTRDVSSG